MHAYLLLGTPSDDQDARLATIYSRHGVGKSSRYVLDTAEGKQSIGIEEIRSLTASLWIQTTDNASKAAVIHNAHKLTTEAQNALLKNLEEPPGSTIFILLAPSSQMLLDTIVSRCTIIPASTDLMQSMTQDDELFISLCEPTVSIGTCITQMESIFQTKEDAQSWYETVSHSLPMSIQSDPKNPLYIRVARLFPLVHTAFDRNVSWKTILTTLIIRTKSHPLDKPEENCVQ